MIKKIEELFDKIDQENNFSSGGLREKYERYIKNREEKDYNFLCGAVWTADAIGLISEKEREKLIAELIIQRVGIR